MSDKLPWGQRPLVAALLPFFGIAAVYAAGLQMDLMDVDTAQYASISREMHDNGSWLQVYDRGTGYLDKPPLLFWLAVASFKIFGISNWAYRLPSVLMSFAAGWAVFSYGRRHYGTNTGYVASLLLLACQAFFLINHDVRTDTLLTSCVALCIWQADKYVTTRQWGAAVLTGVFVGMAMLSKGPIGLLAPGLALVPAWLVQRQWRNLLLPGWLLAAAAAALVLVPMCVGLYRQYGSHGLYFFFWLQSFGRITGENSWSNNPDPIFLIHNTFWALLPFTLVFWGAFIYGCKQLFQRLPRPERPEWASFFGFILPILALNMSRYQLPHYAFVAFPMGAVAAGAWLVQLIERRGPVFKFINGAHIFISWVLMALLVVLCGYCFPMASWTGWLPFAVAMIGLGYLTFKRGLTWRALWLPLVAIMAINLYLNSWVYPSLLQYQSSSQVARYVKENAIDPGRVVTYGIHAYSLDFGLRRSIPQVNSPDQLLETLKTEGSLYIYLDEEKLEEIRQPKVQVQPVAELGHFHITMLTLPFLNPNTRPQTLKRKLLVKVDYADMTSPALSMHGGGF